MRIRNGLYDSGLMKSTSFLDTKVISIGNIAVGGTGKTPVIEFITGKLKDTHKIAVLSRGYKRQTKGFLYVEKNMDYTQTGDEPLQIKLKYPDVTVAVCEDRVEGIKRLKNDKQYDIILLDDAFQHRKVNPSKSILLTEYKQPLFNDTFLPVGRLRDNKREIHRADIVIVTKSPDNILPVENTVWRTNLHLFAFQKLYFSFVKYSPLQNLSDNKKILEHKNLKDYKILLVTGIAKPDYLHEFLKKFNPQINHLKFSDHKNYSEKDISNIFEIFSNIKGQKIIITTMKDAVKFNTLLNNEQKKEIFVQDIEIDFHFDKAEELIEEIVK